LLIYKTHSRVLSNLSFMYFVNEHCGELNKFINLQRKLFNILLIYKSNILKIKRLQLSWKIPPSIIKNKNFKKLEIRISTIKTEPAPSLNNF
jgi:hypothetical protein